MTGKSTGAFLTTRWTVVGSAASQNEVESRQAIGDLFSTYWKPLYRYARRIGQGPEDAEDLIQGFFEHLVSSDGLHLADRDRGRFRSFLLSSLNNYMRQEWRKSQRQKRGGKHTHYSLDHEDAETGFKVEVTGGQSPDQMFDREWAIALLDKVLSDLAREHENFEKWEPYLSLSQDNIPYAETAKELGLSEGAVRVAVHRLRKRYRDLVRSEISITLADSSMVEDEMSALFEALRK